MAFLTSTFSSFLTVLYFFFLLVVHTAMATYYTREEDITHLHFYMHDDYTSPTAIRVVTVPILLVNNTSPRQFGDIVVLNNLLTEGPSPKSEPVGRAQGFAVRVSEHGMVNDLSLHLVFENGDYEGSSLTVHGRIALDQPVRESVVIGGTGHFRFAKGYALSKNYNYNLATGGIVEIDVYVLHHLMYNTQ